MNRRSLSALALVAFLLLTFSHGARAQGTASRVTGVVTDPSGAVVPGAAVTLTNEATKVSFTTETTSTGQYVFESVQVGVYTVGVERQGFKKFSSPGNQLNVNQPVTVDVQLEVGNIADVVTVQAAAELVQTASSGNLGNTVEQRSLEALPIVGERGRNPLQFISLQPGVIGNGRAGTGGNTGGNVHVHGARDRAFNFTLDGIDINESSAGGSNSTPLKPNPDSISQFQVVTSNFTAELGRSSGAQVSLVTRSGTDQFHGTLFELYRTPRLNANEYENTIVGRGRGQFVQHIFGGSLGGPVLLPGYDGRERKTYFFTNLQLLRATQGILVTRTVYTAQARQGLFRYRTNGANAAAGTNNPSVDAAGNPIVPIATYNIAANDPLCATQPTNCGLDPTTQSLINAAPLPNNFAAGDGLNTAGYSFNAPQVERQWDFVTKVDHTFNDRNQIYLRYAQGKQNTFGDNGNSGLRSFPDSPFNRTDTFRNPKNVAFNYRWTPTARVTNEFVAGRNSFAFLFTNPDPVAVPYILNLPRDPFSVVPQVDNQREITTWQFVDNISFISGAHTFRGGTNLRFQKHDDIRSAVGGTGQNVNLQVTLGVNAANTPLNVPGFNLPSLTGANPINNADRTRLFQAINDLLGRYNGFSRSFVAESDSAYAPAGTHFLYVSKYTEYDFYFQDTWKVRPNLTIDFGVRWEPKLSPRAGSDDVVLRPDRPVRLGEAPTDQLKFVEGKLFDDDWNNIAPTVGLAWDPFGSGRTSVRVNYRLAYDRMNTFLASSAIFPNTPGTTLSCNESNCATLPAGEQRRIRFGIPTLTPPSTPAVLRQPVPFSNGSLTVFDPSLRFPKTNQWSLSVQRDVGAGFVFEANYIGHKGVGLFGGYDVNQVNIFAADARCPGETFLAAFNTLRSSGTATSCLANLLFTGSTTNNAGTASFRSTFSSELNQGSVASAALLMSQRTVSGVRTIGQSNNVGAAFFQPYSQFTGGLNVIDSNDYSMYHGLEFQLSRRVGRGLLMQASYTASKSMDTRSFDPTFTVVARTTSATNASPSGQNTPFDIRNRRLNYARSDFDRTHALQGYLVYDLPFGRGQRYLSDAPGVVRQLVGGWEVANALILQSGRPFTVYSGAFTVSNAVLSPANCNGCNAGTAGVVQNAGTTFIFSQGEIDRFSTPAPGELGNTGRNFFTGPRFFNLDMTLRKRFYFGEKTNLEFRADINNLTNSVSFEFPVAATAGIGTQSPGFAGSASTNGAFGRIRDSVNSNARRIQLGLRFNF